MSILTPCHEIEPRLWLGNYEAARSIDVFTNHGFTHVVCLVAELQDTPFAEPLGVTYLTIPAQDQEEYPLRSHFATINTFLAEHWLQNDSSVVLVHCAAGASRSATALAAFLMRHLRLPALSCVNYLQSKRSIVNPNSGFLDQLREYEKELVAEGILPPDDDDDDDNDDECHD